MCSMHANSSFMFQWVRGCAFFFTCVCIYGSAFMFDYTRNAKIPHDTKMDCVDYQHSIDAFIPNHTLDG